MNVASAPPPPATSNRPQLELDTSRGSQGMWLFIATEAALFAVLFFAYAYLSGGTWLWPNHDPPSLRYALPMLGILLVSSLVLYWGEKQVEADRQGPGRLALIAALLIGMAFMLLQVFEYREHLKTLTPQTDAYGSVFYVITSFHALHVVMGLLMLAYVLTLPPVEPAPKPPHRPYHNAALYWHFVDVVWIVVVAILYVVPNVWGGR